MKTKLITKISILFMLLSIPCAAQTQESTPQPQKDITMSEFAAQKILHIRNNPKHYAKNTNTDPYQLFEKFTWMQDKTGLVNKSIKPVQSLVKKSETSEENNLQSGLPSYEGSVSGTISFKNYMEKKDALSIFINNLFQSEASPGYNKKHFILDCRFNLVQAQVKSAESMPSEHGGIQNQYQIKISFASDTDVCYAQTLNIFNFVRNNHPVSQNYILKHFPETGYDYNKYAYPVADTFLQPFFDKSFLKNRQNYKRTKNIYEYYSKSDLSKNTEKAAAVFIMQDLRDTNSNPFIFSSFLKTIDFGFKIIGFNNEKQKAIAKYVLSGSAPEPEDEQLSPVTGLYIQLGTDKNNDYVYNPGEGMANKPVLIENCDSGSKLNYYTDRTGRILLWAKKNTPYIIRYQQNEEKFIERTLYIGENSRYIKLGL